MKELKPCPFCGYEAKVLKVHIIERERPKFKVYCRGCNVRQFPHTTRKGAIISWNQRDENFPKIEAMKKNPAKAILYLKDDSHSVKNFALRVMEGGLQDG